MLRSGTGQRAIQREISFDPPFNSSGGIPPITWSILGTHARAWSRKGGFLATSSSAVMPVRLTISPLARAVPTGLSTRSACLSDCHVGRSRCTGLVGLSCGRNQVDRKKKRGEERRSSRDIHARRAPLHTTERSRAASVVVPHLPSPHLITRARGRPAWYSLEASSVRRTATAAAEAFPPSTAFSVNSLPPPAPPAPVRPHAPVASAQHKTHFSRTPCVARDPKPGPSYPTPDETLSLPPQPQPSRHFTNIACYDFLDGKGRGRGRDTGFTGNGFPPIFHQTPGSKKSDTGEEVRTNGLGNEIC